VSLSAILPILLVVANVMGVGMIVPQVVRFHRSGSTDGVSGTWVGVGVAMNTWWIAYALAEQLWGLLPVSIGATALYLVIGAQYAALTGRPGLRRVLVGTAGFAVIPGIALLAGGWTATGLTMGFAYAVQFSPAAITAVRSVDVSGISPATWTMAWVEAAIWFTYGATVGDQALLVGGGGGALMATIILVRLRTAARVELRLAA
jgi:uncharacterized protein with PQ loop repeat